MSGRAPNVAASVAARLLNRAKQTGDDYQTLLTSFCLERFLYRLAASSVRDRFILKGAMLLRVWSDQPYRATRDLDLLRRGDASFEAILGDIRIACATAVEPDGVIFDPDAARIEAIRAEDEYAGARTTLPARCDTARLTLQIDMGVGDSIWPPPQSCICGRLQSARACLTLPAHRISRLPSFLVLSSIQSWMICASSGAGLGCGSQADRGREAAPVIGASAQPGVSQEIRVVLLTLEQWKTYSPATDRPCLSGAYVRTPAG